MNYCDAVPILRARFPEFTESAEKWDDTLPNDAYGTFALFVCRLVDQGTGEGLISRAFELFNEMAEGDDEVVNLLEVSVLEIMTDHPASLRVAGSRLSTTAKHLLERVQRGGFADA